MRVLLIGGRGQLGLHLQALAPDRTHIEAPDRQALDLADDSSIETQLDVLQPDLIINAAGFTAVDRAESERDVAFAVNAEGPRRLATKLGVSGTRLIHISTDFVFDGTKPSPYLPADQTDPINTYGASKLAGERAVTGLLPARGLVVRTSWLYSAYRQNFVRTMLRLLAERDRVGVVADQVGGPTWAANLAAAIWGWALMPSAAGIRHWADGGTATWYDLAVAVAEEGAAAGLLVDPAEVIPISTAEYPTPARRPAQSTLDATASYEELGLAPQPWHLALRQMLAGYPGFDAQRHRGETPGNSSASV